MLQEGIFRRHKFISRSLQIQSTNCRRYRICVLFMNFLPCRVASKMTRYRKRNATQRLPVFHASGKTCTFSLGCWQACPDQIHAPKSTHEQCRRNHPVLSCSLDTVAKQYTPTSSYLGPPNPTRGDVGKINLGVDRGFAAVLRPLRCTTKALHGGHAIC